MFLTIFLIISIRASSSDVKLTNKKWPELGSGQKYVTFPYLMYDGADNVLKCSYIRSTNIQLIQEPRPLVSCEKYRGRVPVLSGGCASD